MLSVWFFVNVLLCGGPVSAAPDTAARARTLYARGETLASADAFEIAVKKSTSDWKLWVDGAINLSEVGRLDKALAWFRRAAELNETAETRASVGWALLRRAEPKDAESEFSRALALNPNSAWALLGSGRALLAQDKLPEAVQALEKAAEAAPGQSLTDYYLGMAYEKAGNEEKALEAYRRAIGADSFFYEGRGILVRNYVRVRRYQDAWRHLQKLFDADPGSKFARAMIDKIRPLVAQAPATDQSSIEPAESSTPMIPTEAASDRHPAMRIGISSTGMGKPRERMTATIQANGAWNAVDPKSGRIITTGAPNETWTFRLIPARKKPKRRQTLSWMSANGRSGDAPGDSLLIVPADPAATYIRLLDDAGRSPRSFRGQLEITQLKSKRTIRLVNIIGLEDYTHGVVSAEMPARSPLEALKAQAVVARTHAYFIKTISRRHRKDGYDLCDQQHCQVYGGLSAETPRTRDAVQSTRARIAVYKGQTAHVIYSSHCGGHTQSGRDIGWGDVPYWKSVNDADDDLAEMSTPLGLRRRLSAWPNGFDRPSEYVHSSHARWTRAIPVKSLEEKLNRKFRIGKILGLLVLRRAPSGHVNALLILGSKGNKKINDELSLRGLLGVGSLRSTFFVVDTEYRKEAPDSVRRAKKPTLPILVPDTFVFRGGGWGHGVGLCQSGAIGRAEAGHDYETIIRAYFPGVELKSMDD